MKTKEQDLVALLDIVFESAKETDWWFIVRFCELHDDGGWIMKQLLHLLWLSAEDEAAFNEEIWRLTNEAQ